MKKIIVIGAGGHSRSVCDILLQDSENEIVGLIDDANVKPFWNLKVLGSDKDIPALMKNGIATHAFVAIGNNKLRKELYKYAISVGYSMINAISPNAIISPHAYIGQGVALMPGSVIGPNSYIGDGTIVNTNASVDHDDKIGSFCHIAPGTAVCGSVIIGDETFIGAGARIIDTISVGPEVVVGAGAVVTKDIHSKCLAVGVPARIIRNY